VKFKAELLFDCVEDLWWKTIKCHTSEFRVYSVGIREGVKSF